MRRPSPAMMLAVLFFSVSASLSQTSKTLAPDATVRSFYTFHFAHNKNFTRANVQRRRQWLSPELLKLLLNEFKREDEYSKDHPNEDFVPYMEGDPFTSSQEYPTSFQLGKSQV